MYIYIYIYIYIYSKFIVFLFILLKITLSSILHITLSTANELQLEYIIGIYYIII